MIHIKANIVKVIDDTFYPGIVEAVVQDVEGREHHFIDKTPMFSEKDVLSIKQLPLQGSVNGMCLERTGDKMLVDFQQPDDLETTEGVYEMWVHIGDVIDGEIDI